MGERGKLARLVQTCELQFLSLPERLLTLLQIVEALTEKKEKNEANSHPQQQLDSSLLPPGVLCCV